MIQMIIINLVQEVYDPTYAENKVILDNLCSLPSINLNKEEYTM
jgi:hypothetical protein